MSHLPLEPGVDVPREMLEALRHEDDARVSQAIGVVEPSLARAYRWVLLDSLVHELNLLRALLGEPDRLDFVDVSDRNVTLAMTFGTVRCLLVWVDLPGIARYEQEFALYGPTDRLRIVFPSPYLKNMPTRFIQEGGRSGSADSWVRDQTVSYAEPFQRELVEFHDCVVGGREPLTNGEDALADIALSQAIVAHQSMAGRS